LAAGSIIFLYVLLLIVIAGISLIIFFWLREGSIFPGDRTERINRELITEIEKRLARFEEMITEAEIVAARLDVTTAEARDVLNKMFRAVESGGNAIRKNDAQSGTPGEGFQASPGSAFNEQRRDYTADSGFDAARPDARIPVSDTGQDSVIEDSAPSKHAVSDDAAPDASIRKTFRITGFEPLEEMRVRPDRLPDDREASAFEGSARSGFKDDLSGIDSHSEVDREDARLSSRRGRGDRENKVADLYQKGLSTLEIARMLSIGRGEVELLIALLGSRRKEGKPDSWQRRRSQ